MAAKYASNTNLPLEEQMLQIPSEAWEQEFPLLDMCLKDSIRLNLHGTAFRRNVSGKKLMLDNEAIPNGSFVVRLPSALLVYRIECKICRRITSAISTKTLRFTKIRPAGTQVSNKDLF